MIPEKDKKYLLLCVLSGMQYEYVGTFVETVLSTPYLDADCVYKFEVNRVHILVKENEIITRIVTTEGIDALAERRKMERDRLDERLGKN